jgi:hypothetical protein
MVAVEVHLLLRQHLMRSPFLAFTTGIVLLGAANAAGADPVSVNQIIQLQLTSVPRFGVGGPFLANLPGVTNDFLTFCLEYNEYFVPGENLRVGSITTAARNGGVGGSSGGADPISGTTAYLYTQFREGNGAFSNGALLQEAIWYLENEVTSASAAALYLIRLAHEQMDARGWDRDFLGGVQVLNLWRGANYGTRAQDMLTYTASVPEPASALLLALGALGAVAARRRRLLPANALGRVRNP